MRIALRTSGGRGEYELAGRQGPVQASDLFDKQLFYEITPSIILPGRATATRAQGKPRIRLDNEHADTHLYRILAGVLLLPKPKREFKETHGTELLKRDAYSMTAIKVDVGRVQQSRVLLRPTDLLLANADNCEEKVVFAQRMARIVRLWEEAAKHTTPLSGLLQAHKNAVLNANPDHKEIEKYANLIAKALNTDRDTLQRAEQQLGISETPTPVPGAATALTAMEQEFAEDDGTTPVEARLQRVKQWREMAVRGAAGERFRREVRTTYEFRCLFTGQRLPKTEATDSAGVDAAHILPWSTHNINAIKNGLCLSKLCHWAFDAGILKLSFDASSGAYVLEIPSGVRDAANKASFDLAYFEPLAGRIPLARLPANQNVWPSPQYLDELNKFMFAGAA